MFTIVWLVFGAFLAAVIFDCLDRLWYRLYHKHIEDSLGAESVESLRFLCIVAAFVIALLLPGILQDL